MRIYLDTCAIQRPFDDDGQPRIRLEAEAVVSILTLREARDFELVVSAAHEIETERNPYPDRRAHADAVLR